MTTRRPRRRVPFTVIGGFLGAGKTTLVNDLLRHAHGERIAVVVNDMGEVSIDADLIAEHDGSTITLANGCICCSLSDEFALSLPDLLDLDPPIDRVVVEASGISDPGSVAQYGTLPGFRLDGVVVLVDVETIRGHAADARIGPQVLRQLERADLLVLTKLDLVAAHDVSEVRSWIADVVGPVPCTDAPRDGLDPSVLFGLDHVAERDPGGPIDHGFRTTTVRPGAPISRDALDRWLTGLPSHVIRAKGRVHTTDHGPVVVHVVGRRRAITPDRSASLPPPGTGTIVVIGTGDMGTDEAFENEWDELT